MAFDCVMAMGSAFGGKSIVSPMHQLHRLALIEIEKKNPDLSIIDNLLEEMGKLAESNSQPKPNFLQLKNEMKNSKFGVQENGTAEMTFVKSDNTLSIIQKKFKIDFSKVESLEQVIDILKAMDLSIHWYNDNCPEQFKDLHEKGLLIEVK